jgi:hypothetical protein
MNTGKKSTPRHFSANNTRGRGRQVEPRSIDELAVFSEEELHGRFEFLDNDLYNSHIVPGSHEALPWETELAYVQRELEIRRTRKQRHREYMDAMRAEEVNEYLLPEYQGNPPPPNWN